MQSLFLFFFYFSIHTFTVIKFIKPSFSRKRSSALQQEPVKSVFLDFHSLRAISSSVILLHPSNTPVRHMREPLTVNGGLLHMITVVCSVFKCLHQLSQLTGISVHSTFCRHLNLPLTFSIWFYILELYSKKII